MNKKEGDSIIKDQSPPPIIIFQEATPPPPLPTLRSQSFELPRAKQEGVHAHFDKDSSIVRPGMNHTSASHSEGYSADRRPSLHSRKSFTTSVSSFSLYSHFAGERFSDNINDNEKRRRKNKKFSLDHIDIEKKKRSEPYSSSNSSSVEEEEDISSSKNLDEDNDADSRKASVGKAMFMFLKAFIGSGVLFLPKA
jgi:hypothetical protein